MIETQAGNQTAYQQLLSEIYDDDLEELARGVYQRDYMIFGFGKWDG